MNCTFCGGQTKVIDSRTPKDGREVVRRRECLKCGKRFTTREHSDVFISLIAKAVREAYENG